MRISDMPTYISADDMMLIWYLVWKRIPTKAGSSVQS